MEIAHSPTAPYIVLFDGECGLCHRSVQWFIRHDRRRLLAFAPLQGETARPFTAGATTFETIVFVDQSNASAPRVFVRSKAFFEILARLGGAFHLVAWLRFLPAWLIDPPYRLIARHRLRWFGRVDSCARPNPQDASRFLP